MTAPGYAQHVEPNEARPQIDYSFDVAGVSELAHRERSAFKPIYSMNRWWARRSSVVFRAILIGLLDKTSDASVNRVFDNLQTEYPEASDQIILDPFMGGGTTVIESLRAGFSAIGTDLNPLSWFIVRNEATLVDIDRLDAAYERVKDAVAEKISDLYATACPHCDEEAQIVHAFWSKVADCSECGEDVELRRGAVVGRRRGQSAIRYQPIICSECDLSFDAEHDEARITRDQANTGWDSSDRPWSPLIAGVSICPECASPVRVSDEGKRLTKHVDVFALQCPTCDLIATWRGPLRDKAICPQCDSRFEPRAANTSRGLFECSNGHRSSISSTARANTGPLPFRMTAIEGHCAQCAERQAPWGARVGYRFFKAVDSDDLNRWNRAERLWKRDRDSLPWPKMAIGDYEKTNRLVIHNYSRWSELFNSRQLLSLSWILAAIKKEPDESLREALVSAFLGTLEHQNMLNIYYEPYAQSAGAFGRHDFHPKVNPCEGHPWGGSVGRGTFRQCYRAVRSGKSYLSEPFESDYRSGRRTKVLTGDAIASHDCADFASLVSGSGTVMLRAGDSRSLDFIPDSSVDHIVTDPPYADSVQYSELADFFFAWLREALGDTHNWLYSLPESPKSSELVENKSRGHSQVDFYSGLTDVFRECARVLKPDGRLVFTFHHSNRTQWEALYTTIVGSGFEVIAVYPVASEGTRSGNLVFHTNKQSVAYDIIHVCRKRDLQGCWSPVPWLEQKKVLVATVRQRIDDLLNRVDHGQRIWRPDVAIMAWAETIQFYSDTRGQVLSPIGTTLDLRDALDDVEEVIDRCWAYVPESKGNKSLAARSVTS